MNEIVHTHKISDYINNKDSIQWKKTPKNIITSKNIQRIYGKVFFIYTYDQLNYMIPKYGQWMNMVKNVYRHLSYGVVKNEKELTGLKNWQFSKNIAEKKGVT